MKAHKDKNYEPLTATKLTELAAPIVKGLDAIQSENGLAVFDEMCGESWQKLVDNHYYLLEELQARYESKRQEYRPHLI